jgi:hypothetical protein
VRVSLVGAATSKDIMVVFPSKRTQTHERSGKYEDNAKNDGGKAQLIDPENRSEPFSRNRRINSSDDGDDDSDGGVMLFMGRRVVSS